MMPTSFNRRQVLGLGALIAPFRVSSQRSSDGSARRIGVLWLGANSTNYGLGSREIYFRDRLGRRGWVEGRNLKIETRFVGEGERLTRDIEELLAMKVDVVVAMGSSIAIAAKAIPSSVPVVFLVFGDPERSGLIESFAHPGGNMTGIFMPTIAHAGKRLELLHEAVPGSTRIAVMKSQHVRSDLEFGLTEEAAMVLGVELVEMNVRSSADWEAAFLAATKSGATALTVLTASETANNLGSLAELCLAHRLPAIAGYVGFARLGGLMAYGANNSEGLNRAAYFVARILDGVRPADLPVERTDLYVLALNMKTAKELGLSFPKSLKNYANVVIS